MTLKTWDLPKAIRLVVVVASITIALLLAWKAMDILLLTFAGVLFAIFLHRIAKWITKKTKISHSWSLSLTLLLLLVISAGSTIMLLPEISQQTDQLSEQIPKGIQQLRDQLEQSKVLKQALTSVTKGDSGKMAVAAAGGVVAGSVEAVAAFVYILFLGIFLAADPIGYQQGFLSLIAPQRRQRIAEVLDAIGEALSSWLVARLFLMVVIGILTLVGLWILQVPMALTLGVLAGILLFVPYVGAVAASVPGILIALTNSTHMVLMVAGLYLLTHLIEGYILTPIVQKRAMEMSPALLLAFQVLMEAVAGIPGLAMSTPLLAVIIVATQMLYKEDVLGAEPKPMVK